jgi:sugar O-acyltransferase (sialic acid O-acetyltransferase NeuD family)
MTSGAISIVGAGGHAKVVAATIRAAGHEVAAVYDDNVSLWGSLLLGTEIRGPVSRVSGRAVIAIGDNRARQAIASELGASWVSVCHPSATVHESAEIGAGTVIFAGAVVQPDTVIGAHGIINTAASVDHDCRLRDFVHIAPGVRLCGGVSVKEGALVGVGASVCPSVSIGSWAVIGAGAVCVSDVPDAVTVTGVPACIAGPSNG